MDQEEMARKLFSAYQSELKRRHVASIELEFDTLKQEGKDLWFAIADAALESHKE